ncbi:hypothetical protein B0T17DRAFT_654809 [Bombardia bombarda]|uniref:Uncharacterized protein n=1 Tax=Bombardia bombarda TaxID=252184 RepID=A0AA39X179_9PEZI|nr:hypothetical protein B0T17DRAFT_654809 [Bombardia bombarda]
MTTEQAEEPDSRKNPNLAVYTSRIYYLKQVRHRDDEEIPELIVNPNVARFFRLPLAPCPTPPGGENPSPLDIFELDLRLREICEDPEDYLGAWNEPLRIRMRAMGCRAKLVALGGIPSREYRPSAPEVLHIGMAFDYNEFLECQFWGRELWKWEFFLECRAGRYEKRLAEGVISQSHYLPDPHNPEDMLCVLHDFIDYQRRELANSRNITTLDLEEYPVAIEATQRQIDELTRERGPLVCPPLHFHTRRPQPPQETQREDDVKDQQVGNLPRSCANTKSEQGALALPSAAVVDNPVAVRQSPIAEPPVAEPPVAEPPVAEPPVAEPRPSRLRKRGASPLSTIRSR